MYSSEVYSQSDQKMGKFQGCITKPLLEVFSCQIVTNYSVGFIYSSWDDQHCSIVRTKPTYLRLFTKVLPRVKSEKKEK